MNRWIQNIMAFALMVIAGNMTYANLNTTDERPTEGPRLTEQVLEVIGRTSLSINPARPDPAFLVRDNLGGIRLVRYDQNSSWDRPDFQPRYLLEQDLGPKYGTPFYEVIVPTDTWNEN